MRGTGLEERILQMLGGAGPIGDQRAAFNVPAEIAYFNTANLAPQLRAVRVAGEAALDRRGRPWTISAAEWFDDVERLRSPSATCRSITASACLCSKRNTRPVSIRGAGPRADRALRSAPWPASPGRPGPRPCSPLWTRRSRS